MNEIEAIEIIKNVDICCNTAETARDLAIHALQEKAECEKGCGHCRVDENNKTDEIVFENGNDLVEVQLCYGMLEIIYKTDGEVAFHLDADINYCPMCGRKLVEE